MSISDDYLSIFVDVQALMIRLAKKGDTKVLNRLGIVQSILQKGLEDVKLLDNIKTIEGTG